MVKLPIYMDYNATTPCDPQVVAAMLPYFGDHFGNAASHAHAFGWVAGEAVSLARERLAALLESEPGEIVFTSGATESVNLALKGAFEMYHAKGTHLVTCVTEHKAVLDTCSRLERRGARVTYLPVEADGSLDLMRLEEAITPGTVLVALMAANNETGVIHPLAEISAIVHRKGSLLFSDATQAVGKTAFTVTGAGVDMAALSAHKIYGPKGVGALYVRRRSPRVRLTAQMDGGGHEKGLRSGTLNVPGIVGMGVACQLAEATASAMAKLAVLRDHLEAGLMKLGGVRVNGAGSPRLPHVANLAFEGVDGRQLLGRVTRRIALSSGSACTSALPEPSHVLLAMGVPPALADASLRFSLGRFTTDEEVDFALGSVARDVAALRGS